MPRRTINGSYGNCMFRFITNCQFVFQRGCSILHSHLWQIQFFHILSSTWYCYYFFFHFFPSDRCAGMPHWGFNLCFFDVEHISMCLYASCIFHEMPIHAFVEWIKKKKKNSWDGVLYLLCTWSFVRNIRFANIFSVCSLYFQPNSVSRAQKLIYTKSS